MPRLASRSQASQFAGAADSWRLGVRAQGVSWTRPKLTMPASNNPRQDIKVIMLSAHCVMETPPLSCAAPGVWTYSSLALLYVKGFTLGAKIAREILESP